MILIKSSASPAPLISLPLTCQQAERWALRRPAARRAAARAEGGRAASGAIKGGVFCDTGPNCKMASLCTHLWLESRSTWTACSSAVCSLARRTFTRAHLLAAWISTLRGANAWAADRCAVADTQVVSRQGLAESVAFLSDSRWASFVGQLAPSFPLGQVRCGLFARRTRSASCASSM